MVRRRTLPFRPAVTNDLVAEFYQAARNWVAADKSQRSQIIQEEVERANSPAYNRQQSNIYRAVWLLLDDLLRLGWAPAWNIHTQGLELTPPEDDYTFVLNDQQLVNTNVQEFMRKMEAGKDELPSITALVASHELVAAQLQKAKQIENAAERHQALNAAVRPYLQLVERNVRCEFTGHELTNIWRYFRHRCLLPYYSVPGRSMYYLVRDEAQLNHPVIGIALLASPLVQLKVRDNYLRWTSDAFIEHLIAEDQSNIYALSPGALARQSISCLLEQITIEIGETSVDGICTQFELDNPTPETLTQLLIVEQEQTKEWHTRLYDMQDKLKIEARSKARRASKLAELLQSNMEIRSLLNRTDFSTAWRPWLSTSSGKAAVRTAMRVIKMRHITANIFRLHFCGTIPPYSALLGDQLVSLLMCSPQVVTDYHQRYSNVKSSQIASGLKGTDVVRPADLVFLEVYTHDVVSTSGYDSLKLPAGLLRRDAPAFGYELLGETCSYRPLPFSPATISALHAAGIDDGLPTSIFGKGVNTKVRNMERGLVSIFGPEQHVLLELLLRHPVRRPVFGAFLAENGQAYLRDEDATPLYPWADTLDPREGTQRIASYWVSHWLDPYLQTTPSMPASSARVSLPSEPLTEGTGSTDLV